MRDSTHPDYHKITVVMTDGTQFETRSTYGKEGDKLHLDIDSKSHPAWTGQHRMVDRGGQLAKFNKRFSGLGKTEGAAASPAANAGSEAPADKIKLTTSKKTVAKK